MTENEIREIIERETHAWDTQDVKLLLTVFHPDLVNKEWKMIMQTSVLDYNDVMI